MSKYYIKLILLGCCMLLGGCNNITDKGEPVINSTTNIENDDIEIHETEARDIEIHETEIPDTENLYIEENVVSEEWKDKYIEKISMDAEIGDPYSNTYRLIDIDGIQPPELYVNGVCEAVGAKIITFYNNSIFEQHLSRLNGLIYEPGTGTFINENGNMAYYRDNIYTLKKGKFENIHNGEFNCGDVDGRGPIFDEATGEMVYFYYWEGEEVLKEEYESILLEYVKNPHIVSEEEEYTIDEMIEIIENY